VSDADGRARAFLAGQPVGYPSYSDVDGAVARSLGAPQGLPVTLFLDANGRVFHVHAGAYASERRWEKTSRLPWVACPETCMRALRVPSDGAQQRA
jgi:hypothetical protein